METTSATQKEELKITSLRQYQYIKQLKNFTRVNLHLEDPDVFTSNNVTTMRKNHKEYNLIKEQKNSIKCI
ncbi:hypothetical protein [Bacillus velezensis]|uniref:hypothetical protein n=1 Tax=Bacillus velezensis TaxID=492670 RepID=UPI001CFA5920|nr:hypothetical protein [Bacillus velezensis]GJI61697.1 hypothetical protein BVSY1_08530 [Bacillus velezensis]